MHSSTPPATTADIALEISGLSKRFGDVTVLDDVSVRLRRGERLVVCGPSGSGKSTLVRCINGLESHDAGEIRVDGLAVTTDERALAEVRRRCGMVFQHFNLFPHMTCYDNCAIGLRHVARVTGPEARRRIMTLLERLGVAEQAAKYPSQLSGGQQQRVAIARALCLEPRLMLFDEPTSALDPEVIQDVLQAMIDLGASGMTMVCVTHEMGFARQFATDVVLMEAGRVAEYAPAAQFFSDAAGPRAKSFLSGFA